METSKTLLRGEIRVSDERAQRRGELVLGRYRLLERLGAGGFGTVWRASDEQLGRTVALKRIGLPSAEERERAMREAHATARLAHPAIVALYEACADGDAFYLISELVEGDTLAQLIEQDSLCDEEIVEIGLALADALAHAHARGVIHRDVKPQNVLVADDAAQPEKPPQRTPQRRGLPAAAKLADFGGALLAGGEVLTRTGDVFGTLAYMAPEQSEGHAAGPPADLYSLALILYEAFSGVNPVRGLTPAATARRIGEPVAPLEQCRRDLPRELTRAIDESLRVDPQRRGSLADLHNALAQALERGLRRGLFSRRAEAGRTRVDTTVHVHEPVAPAVKTAWQPAAPAAPPLGAPVPAEDPPEPSQPHRLALPRGVWLGLVLAVAVWQAAAGRAGGALLLLAAAAPLLLLARRSGPGWLTAAAAPALGLAGLAGAFPALAGQRSSWRARAGLAALGFWWLALAEPLLARRLWLGPPSGLPPREAWEASLAGTASHVIAGVLTPQLAIGALVWAAAALLLPWIVRGRSAGLDVLLAIAWTVALLGGAPLIERAVLADAAHASPRGVLLGAMLGCVLA
ncbi:MAG TPA: serine/threonine-protein kinase, partial [Solirubrobacteraceae bacterium]|nr:serine/threonine-protein kinase [Solirubrobacteraceae bacterium]